MSEAAFEPTFPITPAVEADGTLTAIVVKPATPLGTAALLTVALPTTLEIGLPSGRYFLARCGAQTPFERAEQWPIVLRRPLFLATAGPVAVEEAGDGAIAPQAALWELLLPGLSAAGDRWIAQLPAGTSLNLLGPLGQGFTLQPLARNLLLITDLPHLPLLLGLLEQMLDQRGRVTLLLRLEGPLPESVRNRLPLAVELRLAYDDADWQQQLGETIRWADQVAAALPNATYPLLAQMIRQNRLRLERGFAHVFVQADLACGVGACLACTIPLPDGGLTRACVHGPVFDLAAIC
jgi:dihydroorotate dehydrogenase electron transfer subunit